MTRGSLPKANAMLVCDYVITDQGTNKKSLIGIFEHINAAKFPCVHHSLSVYVKMTDARGAYRIRLELVDLAQGIVLAQGEPPRELSILDPLSTHELVFGWNGLTFPHPGDYEFRVYANGQIFGQKKVSVVERSQGVS